MLLLRGLGKIILEFSLLPHDVQLMLFYDTLPRVDGDTHQLGSIVRIVLVRYRWNGCTPTFEYRIHTL